MTIALDLGPQNVGTFQQQLNVLRLQVNALAGVSTLTESVAPQQLDTYVNQLNVLIGQINGLGGTPALAYVNVPNSPGTLNDQMNRLRLAVNAISFNSPYAAGAVHFDGSTSGRVASVAGADTAYISWAFWFKIASSPADSDFPVLWAVDPEDTYPNGSGLYGDSGAAGVSSFFKSALGGTGADDFPGISTGEWHFYTGTAFASGSGPANNIFSYLDGTPAQGVIGNNLSTLPMSGLPFWIGADGTNVSLTGDVADFWIARQPLYDGGVGDAAVMAKFIADGKPVYLGASGELPTGTAADVFCSGDATGFLTNNGAAGALAWTGALTNASTSPSD